jgi:two-component system cell cycle response regulator DivK
VTDGERTEHEGRERQTEGDEDAGMDRRERIARRDRRTSVEAVTGEDGVKLAKERKPDLVLMDIQLPGISGIEAFKQIRSDAKTKAIPVIAVTASVTPTDRTAISAAGFDAFLGKPINLKEFIDTVKRLVEKAKK